MLRVAESKGSLSLFSSIAEINTGYLGGTDRGNRVELATESIVPTMLTYRVLGLPATLQHSRIGDQFTDATNTTFTNRRATSYPGPGLIPTDGRSFYVSLGFSY
jgi:Fe(3+) dicitrate transport protein